MFLKVCQTRKYNFRYQVGKIGEDFPHPGVGPVSSDAELKFHRWYQWVAFFLTFQAILFYIPRYLWKYCEGQHIQMLIQDLQQPLMSAADKKDQMKNLATYFLTHRGFHSSYALKFFALELLNLVNVLGQMYFIDVFLDGEFSTYGMDVWNFTGKFLTNMHSGSFPGFLFRVKNLLRQNCQW